MVQNERDQRLGMREPPRMLDPARLIALPDARLLVVAPHPDDESIVAGGLLARAQMLGTQVQVLLLTDGDRNPWPQRWLEQRLLTGDADRARWGERRRGEAQRALHELGLPTSALVCFGWPDLGITERLIASADTSTRVLANAIGTFKPTVLVFPALRDRHPDHGACHVLVHLALALLDSASPVCLCYHVHGVAPAELAMTLHLNADEQKRKQRAVLAHASQLALSRGRLLRKAGSVEAFWPAEACEPVDAGVPAQGFMLPWDPPRLLRPVCELLLATRTRAWRQALPPVDEDLIIAGDDVQAPVFAKLRTRRRNPWIFDHWGWRCLRRRA